MFWHLLTSPLHVVPDTLKANQILFHESHHHQTPVCTLWSIFIHYPSNLGNYKDVFPHQFHFFFLLEGGERKNENANKLRQVASKFFSSSTCKANALYPTATNYFHVSPSEAKRKKGQMFRPDDRSLGLKPRLSNQVSVLGVCPQAVKRWKDLKEFYVSPLNGCFCLDREGVIIINTGIIKATTVAPMIYWGLTIF